MRIISILFASFILFGCIKDKKEQSTNCDIQAAYINNALKVTVTNGIWGTVAFKEGNCMPVLPSPPAPSSCKTCPVKRTVRIYEYTTRNQATPQSTEVFYDSFNTQLIKEIETDNEGFFQAEIAPGNYTIVVMENGRLYAFGHDGQSGISPFNYAGGQQNINLTLTYKAVF